MDCGGGGGGGGTQAGHDGGEWMDGCAVVATAATPPVPPRSDGYMVLLEQEINWYDEPDHHLLEDNETWTGRGAGRKDAGRGAVAQDNEGRTAAFQHGLSHLLVGTHSLAHSSHSLSEVAF
ncbi:hypothetical protein RRF57_002180 [Xylaria bambusicola]|uniref:Uncharacterized protein n=1 Tax=Xylaria bambusicola TaxID=326684 RepID=A0AAN7YVF1_9PEZI